MKTWRRTETGYEMSHEGSTAILSKSGRQWVLVYSGHEVVLGRKATFDAAERVMQTIRRNMTAE